MFTRRCLTVARSLTNTASTTTSQTFRNTSILPSTPVVRRHFSSSKSSDPDYVPIDAALAGRQFEVAVLGNFPDSPSVSAFGTLKHPALIYSGFPQRIVGCVGGENLKHRLLWFQLKEGKKHICSECGQVFKLVNDHNFHEVKELVDIRTKQHYEYYGTLSATGKTEGGAPGVAVLLEKDTEKEKSGNKH